MIATDGGLAEDKCWGGIAAAPSYDPVDAGAVAMPVWVDAQVVGRRGSGGQEEHSACPPKCQL